MKVLLKLPLSLYSGYGNDGYGIVRAFVKLGADVYIQNSAIQEPLAPDVAKIMAKPLQAPFDLVVDHVDPAALELSDGLKKETKLAIAWTMWEFSDFENLQPFDAASDLEQDFWDRYDIVQRSHKMPVSEQYEVNELKKTVRAEAKKKFKQGLKNFDAIVGYDQNSVNCFEPYFDGPRIIQQGGYAPADWQELERDWTEKELRFCMIGVLSERKNPFAAIQAFSELKAEDKEFDKWARLSLKTSAPGLHSKMEDVYPGLRIFYDAWPVDVVKQFYAANHVLLAPSRGEGKNMPALEFQSTGGAVMATNWGGHTQWLSSEYGYPIEYTLAPIDPAHPTTLNANVNVQHLKKLMLHAFYNRDEIREKGRLAAQVIPAISSWEVVVEKMLFKLRDVPGGEELWAKYLMARAQ